MSRKCYLQNLETSQRILIPHNEPTVIGRDRNTLIRDKTVSKQQLELVADVDNRKLKLKQIGANTSGINGFAVMKQTEYTIGHEDVIEVKIGCHKFKVIFESEEENTVVKYDDLKEEREPDEPSNSKRIKLSFPIFNTTKKETQDGKSSRCGVWEHIDDQELLIYTQEGCVPQTKIAAFDLDGTLIKTKSGARFPKNADDWEFYLPNIRNHLEKLHLNNFKLVIFTNQSGVGKDSSKIKEFKRKIENILGALNLPMQVFIALGKNFYRKPMPGMWEKLLTEKNEKTDVDVRQSIYVGDAAGREKNWAPKRNKDHSCSDRLFAMNIGLRFYTPEEYFLKQPPAPYKMPEFNPQNYSPPSDYPDLSYDKQHVVIMVGGPGSGKSHFCKKHLLPKGYIHISRDILGSWQKCVKSMEEHLQATPKRNVVIDNTNGDIESRKRYIDVAKKYKIDVRCFVMMTTKNQAKHNNKFRELTDASHAQIADIIIASYWKNYKEPTISEGYVDIVKIPFIPQFDNEEHEKLYKMFLTD